jgi:hypothetical protein
MYAQRVDTDEENYYRSGSHRAFKVLPRFLNSVLNSRKEKSVEVEPLA